MTKRMLRPVILLMIVFLAVTGVMLFIHFSAVSASSVKDPDTPHAPDQTLPATGNWIFTVNFSETNLMVVNTATDLVYGPFLEDELALNGGVPLDLVVLPDYRTLLISNFSQSAVHFINIENPIEPTWMMSVTLPFFAEDIALGNDGRYAFVTDGSSSNVIAAIDLISPTNIYTGDLGMHQAQSVAVGPDGTIVIGGYDSGQIHTVQFFEDTGLLTVTNSYTHEIGDYIGWPANIGIAPDGETVVVCDAFTSTLAVYRITDVGELTFTQAVTGLVVSPEITRTSGAVQSIAFNEVGDRAYVAVQNLRNLDGELVPDVFTTLEVVGPGELRVLHPEAAIVPRNPTTGIFYGVDTTVVAKDKVYQGYQTQNYTETNYLVGLDLGNYEAYTVAVSGKYDFPTGVAQAPIDVEARGYVDRPAARPGEIVTYTFVLTNHLAGVNDIVVADALPEGVEFVGPVTIDPPDAGVSEAAPPVIAEHVSLTPESVVTVSFPVRVLQLPEDTYVQNHATIYSPEIRFPGFAETTFLAEWFKLILPLAIK